MGAPLPASIAEAGAAAGIDTTAVVRAVGRRGEGMPLMKQGDSMQLVADPFAMVYTAASFERAKHCKLMEERLANGLAGSKATAPAAGTTLVSFARWISRLESSASYALCADSSCECDRRYLAGSSRDSLGLRPL